jgi:methylenetetrahydrofolate reductase (NADPH)
MRFRERYAQATGPVISFEVFPPKSAAAEAKFKKTLRKLSGLGPSFMTCTYGAGGSTHERSLEVASWINHEIGLDGACHLTCVGASRTELRGTLARIREAGAENIVALRGDPPRSAGGFEPPPDGLAHGNELVSLIRAEERANGHRFGVAVAGYPETHPEASDPDTDVRNLKRKVDAGADLVITQLFFDNQDFFGFVERARGAGIDVPIVPGLMPIQSAHQIKHIVSMCGAAIPDDLRQQLDQAGEDVEAVHEIGTRHCLGQARDLLASGVPGIHFYVLNSFRQISFIMKQLQVRQSSA